MLKMMNVDMNEDHALHLFTVSTVRFIFLKCKKKRGKKKLSSASCMQMADKSESGSLEIEQFVQFYKMLTQRDEVWKVFQDYSADGEKLLLEELENFLRIEQQEGEQSPKHARELIACYEPSDTGTVKTDWDASQQPQRHRPDVAKISVKSFHSLYC